MSGNPGDFSFSAGLPYDDEQPAASSARSNPQLDFALDDYPRQRQSRERAPHERMEPEERPANLYLLSEMQPKIRHKMASDLLDSQSDLDHGAAPSYPVPTDDPSVRTNALYLHGSPLTELPTDKVFTYVTSFSASIPLGVEWITDDRLVIVFPSSKAASIALASLLVDPDAYEGPMTAQRVPVSLWPSEYKKDRHAADEGEAAMEMDVAGESSAVMEGALEVRWARLEDKKARTNRSDSNFYRKNGAQAGKPRLAPEVPRESPSYNNRAPVDRTWRHDQFDGGDDLPSRRQTRDDDIDLLNPSFSLERPAHLSSRRSASPDSRRDQPSLLRRFSRSSRSRSPPGLSSRIDRRALGDRLGEIEYSASGDLLDDGDLLGSTSGRMASDALAYPTQAELLAGPAKGRGMMMDQPYVQQGARLPRPSEREREYRPSRGGNNYDSRDPSTRATSFSSRQDGGRTRREDLDGDLDSIRGGRGGRAAGGGSGKRESKRVEDLDDELEQFLKQR